MAWPVLLGKLIGPVSSAIGKWQDRRREVAQAKHEASIERIKAQRGDWKDEAVLIIVTYPFITMFLPFEPLQRNTFEAFERLSNLPEWYVGLYAGICMAVFGIQAIPKLRK